MLFLAGHPVLDFLNTRMRVGENLVDCMQSDEDVLVWLKQAGFAAPINSKLRPLHLLRSARMLRENIRSLVESRKKRRRGNLSVLNRFLQGGQSYPQLVWDTSNRLKIKTISKHETVESVLSPVAEAAADLLTTADFELVKRCEEKSCVLWFFDQTKSHNRRWCSMELCGNRHKVAAYRARRHDLHSR